LFHDTNWEFQNALSLIAVMSGSTKCEIQWTVFTGGSVSHFEHNETSFILFWVISWNWRLRYRRAVLLLCSVAQIALYMKIILKRNDAIFQEIIIFIFTALRRWKQYVPPKRQYISTTLDCKCRPRACNNSTYISSVFICYLLLIVTLTFIILILESGIEYTNLVSLWGNSWKSTGFPSETPYWNEYSPWPKNI